AGAGAIIRVRGSISAAADGGSIGVQAASIEQIEAPSWTARLRSAAEGQTDSAFGSDAPLVRALVLADMQGMPPEVRDRWAAAGIAMGVPGAWRNSAARPAVDGARYRIPVECHRGGGIDRRRTTRQAPADSRAPPMASGNDHRARMHGGGFARIGAIGGVEL